MKSCFGTIYPDLEKFQFNKELAGKVFSLRINTVGPFHRERRLGINTAEWEQCQGCELFRAASTCRTPNSQCKGQWLPSKAIPGSRSIPGPCTLREHEHQSPRVRSTQSYNASVASTSELAGPAGVHRDPPRDSTSEPARAW